MILVFGQSKPHAGRMHQRVIDLGRTGVERVTHCGQLQYAMCRIMPYDDNIINYFLWLMVVLRIAAPPRFQVASNALCSARLWTVAIVAPCAAHSLRLPQRVRRGNVADTMPNQQPS